MVVGGDILRLFHGDECLTINQPDSEEASQAGSAVQLGAGGMVGLTCPGGPQIPGNMMLGMLPGHGMPTTWGIAILNLFCRQAQTSDESFCLVYSIFQLTFYYLLFKNLFDFYFDLVGHLGTLSGGFLLEIAIQYDVIVIKTG
ncbi:unnamed protein product [Protopolystoma xenopodis]|uniref:Uncharacterized protein n=1 Tax=Protopolystoma xenopodis TaxID=117903 RepID=A0A3S5B9F0_9PLAT|nr:unnamed protein product [Protopolystoma xenopodis]